MTRNRWLAVALLVLALGDDDGPDDGHQQEQAAEFDGQQVVGEERLAEVGGILRRHGRAAVRAFADLLRRQADRAAVGRERVGRDAGQAEDLLAEEASRNPKSQPLLLMLANVLFLDGKPVNSAQVLKQAESLSPLDERNRFLLALSYIAIGRNSS